MSLKILALLMAWAASGFAAIVHVSTVQFYNPISQPSERFRGDLEPMMQFIKALESSAQHALEANGCMTPALVQAVVGLPPKGRARVWLIDWDAVLSAEKQAGLIRQLEALPAPKPVGGPVAFALTLELCGATTPKNLKPTQPPIPAEWKRALEAVSTPVTVPDGLPGGIWGLDASDLHPLPEPPKDTSAALLATGEMHAPEGYEVHDLGPMGGQVVMPRGWFYNEASNANGLLFTISKENGANYQTGLRIQFIMRVKATVGITPAEAVQMNLRRKRQLETVLGECPPAKSGRFWRICLETEGYPSKAEPQKKLHMQYSFWWDDAADIMMASTFGAPAEEWLEARKVHAVMKNFELVDRDRMEAAKAKAPAGPAK